MIKIDAHLLYIYLHHCNHRHNQNPQHICHHHDPTSLSFTEVGVHLKFCSILVPKWLRFIRFSSGKILLRLKRLTFCNSAYVRHHHDPASLSFTEVGVHLKPLSLLFLEPLPSQSVAGVNFMWFYFTNNPDSKKWVAISWLESATQWERRCELRLLCDFFSDDPKSQKLFADKSIEKVPPFSIKWFQRLALEPPHNGEQWILFSNGAAIHICQLHWRIFMAWSLPRFALPVSKWRCVIEKWVHQIVSKLVFMQGTHLWEKWKAWCANFCQACHQLMWVKTSFARCVRFFTWWHFWESSPPWK